MRVIDTRDHDRVHISFNANGVTPPGAEAAQTLSIFKGSDYNTAPASFYDVTTGKRLRITSVRLATDRQVAGASALTFRIRLTTALTGNLIYLFSVRNQIVTYVSETETIPEGIEIHGNTRLRFSLSSAGVQACDLNVHGYEY